MLLTTIKIKKIFNKVVDNYVDALEYAPEWFKTQKMCDKAFSEDFFILKYCLDRYKTQKICHKTVDNF